MSSSNKSSIASKETEAGYNLLEQTSNFIRINYLYLTLLLLNTLVMIILGQFVNRDFPDSANYILMIEYFQGSTPIESLIPPFSYRPLLPFIVSFMPFSIETSFLIVNSIFLFVIALCFYILSLRFNIPRYAAFLASSVCMTTHTVLYYGTAILVDTAALAMMCIAALLITSDEIKKHWISITLLLCIGVAFKETAIVIAIAYLLKSRDILRSVPIFALPGIVYLTNRFLFDPSSSLGFPWSFKSYNFENPGATILVFILGFMNQVPFVLIAIIGYLKKWYKENGHLSWFLIMGFSMLPVLLFGLLFGHFSTRFVWPMYIALIPLIGVSIQIIFSKLSSLVGSQDESNSEDI